MKIKQLLVVLFVFYTSMAYAACTVPTSGSRIWDIAPVNLSLTDVIANEISTIESAVFPLSFMGTFTVLNSLASLLSSIETKGQLLSSASDVLLGDVQDDVSSLSVLSGQVAILAAEIAQFAFDMTGVFTTLSAFKTTVSGTVDQQNSEIDLLDEQAFVIIQSAVAQEITIVSFLDQISNEVGSINSILDGISVQNQLDLSASFIEKLAQSYETLESSLLHLEGVLSMGFAGTFTALEVNLMVANTIESLVDAIKILPADISGTYTALDELNETINLVGSNIDLISKGVITIASEVDMLSSQFSTVNSKLSSLSSVTDFLANNNSAIGLLAADITLLEKDYSLLSQIMMNDSLSEMISLFASSVGNIDLELLLNNSLLATTSNLLQTDISKLAVSEVTNAAAISKLSIANLELAAELETAFTIESLIDNLAFSIDSGTLISKSHLLTNDLVIIPGELQTICSKIDQLIVVEDAINSNVDGITAEAQSSLSLASTIESKVNAIESIVEVASGVTLNSKLAVINNEAIMISSKMSIVDSDIAGLIFTAQDMVTDFQETWTILQSISNILGSDQLGLQTVSSKIYSLDLSGVYTVISNIIVQESTINSNVETANSLADRLNQLRDFSTVFTALSGIAENMNTINSQVDILNSDVSMLQSYLGAPIYNRDVGTSGYVISKPGRYYLAEYINYTGTVSSAITISASDVFLDLNNNMLEYVGTVTGIVGITITAVNNVYVVNGTISGFGSNISVNSGASNLMFDGLILVAGDIIINAANNIIMNNDIIRQTNSVNLDSVSLYGPSNIKVSDCFFLDGHKGLEIRTGGAANLYVADSMFVNSPTENGLGFAVGNIPNCVVKRLLCQNMNVGINLAGSVGSIYVLDSDMINCSLSGTILGGNTGGNIFLNNSAAGCGVNSLLLNSSNSFVGFNTMVMNASAGINIDQQSVGSSANTILGNFAFNSFALGNPNNRNYSITSGSSNITNKFLTINQTGTSRLPVLAGEWYNINMLP